MNIIKKIAQHLPYSSKSIENTAFKKRWFRALFRQPKFLIIYCFSKFSLLFDKNKYGEFQIHASYQHFFEFEFHEKNINPNHYLYHRSNQHLLASINDKKATEVINDKFLFWKFCKENNLNTPTVIAWKTGKEQFLPLQEICERENDIFIKPIHGSQSLGIVEGIFEHNFLKLSDEYRTIPKKFQEEYLNYKLAKMPNFIIQEKLKNHADLLKLGAEKLLIIRILAFSRNNKIELHRPVLYHHLTDNYLSPNLTGKDIYQLDIHSGEIACKFNFPWNDKESISLLNNVLPHWEALKQLVEVSHGKLKNIALIGWDLAITDAGAIIIEANGNPWLDIHQKYPYTPFLGEDGIFCEI